MHKRLSTNPEHLQTLGCDSESLPKVIHPLDLSDFGLLTPPSGFVKQFDKTYVNLKSQMSPDSQRVNTRLKHVYQQVHREKSNEHSDFLVTNSIERLNSQQKKQTQRLKLTDLKNSFKSFISPASRHVNRNSLNIQNTPMTERTVINDSTVFKKKQLPKIEGNPNRLEAVLTQRSTQQISNEAFNMTMLKQFPNASFSKTLYRQNAKNKFKIMKTELSSDEGLKEEDSVISIPQDHEIKVVENSILDNTINDSLGHLSSHQGERKPRNNYLNSSNTSTFSPRLSTFSLQISEFKDNNLKKIIQNLIAQNIAVNEEVKNQGSMLQIIQYLKLKDDQILKTYEKVFREYLVLPKIIDDLISTIFESKQTIFQQLIKTFTHEKKVSDYYLKQIIEEKKQMSVVIGEYHKKIKEEKEYAANLFQKNTKFETMLEDYSMTQGILELMPTQAVLHDTYSGSDQVLENALQNLNRSQALQKLEPIEADLATMPIESVMEIIDAKTSKAQKMTAFRVLQRYFRNVKTRDASENVNQFENFIELRLQLEDEIDKLSFKIEKLQQNEILLAKQNERLVAQDALLKVQLTNKDIQIKQLKTQLELKEYEKNEADHKMISFKKKLDDNQDEMQELSNNFNKQRKECKNLKVEKVQIMDEFDQLEEKYNQLKAQIQGLDSQEIGTKAAGKILGQIARKIQGEVNEGNKGSKISKNQIPGTDDQWQAYIKAEKKAEEKAQKKAEKKAMIKKQQIMSGKDPNDIEEDTVSDDSSSESLNFASNIQNTDENKNRELDDQNIIPNQIHKSPDGQPSNLNTTFSNEKIRQSYNGRQQPQPLNNDCPVSNNNTQGTITPNQNSPYDYFVDNDQKKQEKKELMKLNQILEAEVDIQVKNDSQFISFPVTESKSVSLDSDNSSNLKLGKKQTTKSRKKRFEKETQTEISGPILQSKAQPTIYGFSYDRDPTILEEKVELNNDTKAIKKGKLVRGSTKFLNLQQVQAPLDLSIGNVSKTPVRHQSTFNLKKQNISGFSPNKKSPTQKSLSQYNLGEVKSPIVNNQKIEPILEEDDFI